MELQMLKEIVGFVLEIKVSSIQADKTFHILEYGIQVIMNDNETDIEC